MAKPGKQPQHQRDQAIAYTLFLNDLIDRDGSLVNAPRCPASFPPQFSTDEVFVAQAPFQLMEFTTARWNGSGGSFVFGPAPLVAGAMVVNAVNESHRQAALTPQWRVIDAGALTVSSHGFYESTATGLYQWDWLGITSGDLVGEGQFLFDGSSTKGPVRYILLSDFAELVFTLWARSRYPTHYRFLSGAWIPAGWASRMSAAHEPIHRFSERWMNIIPPS